MKFSKFPLFGLLAFAAASASLFGQAPVIVQAESGTLGAEITSVAGTPGYITAATNTINPGNPGSAARAASYAVVFPQAGTYHLYARIRVTSTGGATGPDDDSFFYGNGFGAQAVDDDNGWITVNGLFSGGFTGSSDVVTGSGGGEINVWKWVKLSAFTGSGENPITFTVPAGALTQTFQIGMRENGLDIDQFAFGLSTQTFTVANLDAGQPGTGTPPPEPYTPSGPPLATGLNKFLGGIYSNSQRANFTAYFNQVTPENAGKWGSVEGTRDVMNWAELDAAYALAKENGFPFRFHVLVWGSQQPNWIESLPPAEQLEEIEEWFKAVAARYPAIDYLEVVNEPTHAPPTGATGGGRGNYIAALGGSGATGWDWILNAFRMARLYFPATTKLVLNEYSVTNESARMQTYIGIVNLLKTENLIDAVGVQGHYFSTRSYSGDLPGTTAQMKANLDLLAVTGTPIIVTEMDIDGGTPAAPDDATQLSEYQRIFPVLWEHPSVIGITLWGYRPGLWRNAQAAYLVLENGAERPAMVWLKDTVRGERLAVATPVKTEPVEAGGTVTLTAAANGVPAPTLQWQRNGTNVTGETNATLTLENLQPASTGLYAAVATNASGTAKGQAAIVGLSTSEKVIGTGEVVDTDVVHPNTRIFDQVLLTGLAEAITADEGQVTRTSFIDLDGDIVQVEFSGPGTLSLVAEGSPDRAPPTKYTQPNTSYITGHAGIVITGATEQTNVSVFTVGRATANDPTGAYNILLPPSEENDPAKNGSPLFVGHESTDYDGVADIAFIAIASSNGRFGGVRTANAAYFAAKGITGIYAPGVAFSGPVYLGDISAADDARPMIVLGNASDTRITGGDLHQANGAAIEVHGIDLLKFVAGGDSHGRAIAAQPNAAVLMQGGVNVTADIVVNPPQD